MVLELKVPEGATFDDLRHVSGEIFLYALSFVFLGIYWNNHHHMLHATSRVSGGILWANSHLLFWLSLVPFVTSWMGEDAHAPLPTATYGVVLLCAAIAYTILQAAIIKVDGQNSKLRAAVGRDRKGKISAGLYVAAVLLAYVSPWMSHGIYITVALIWLVPDKRIEAALGR